MNAVVIYESLTGTTARAAALIAEGLTEQGLPTRAFPITGIDFQALSEADVVIVGSWTDGLVFVGQKPGRSGRLVTMPALTGKKAFVYATYAVDAGKVLDKLVKIVEGRGAEVLGGMTIRRGRVPQSSADFVARVLDVLSPVG